jgi:hypothetical protein
MIKLIQCIKLLINQVVETLVDNVMVTLCMLKNFQLERLKLEWSTGQEAIQVTKLSLSLELLLLPKRSRSLNKQETPISSPE